MGSAEFYHYHKNVFLSLPRDGNGILKNKQKFGKKNSDYYALFIFGPQHFLWQKLGQNDS